MSGKPSNLREITIWRNEKMEQVKLLMTELSPELTRLCAETLAAQDIAVTVCEKDGAKALAALSAEKPDAVLLDAFMPGLDALTVKQRYDEAGGGKTVFFVTHDVDEAILLSTKIFVLGQSPSNVIFSCDIPSDGRPTRETQFEDPKFLNLRNTLIRYINQDVASRIS